MQVHSLVDPYPEQYDSPGDERVDIQLLQAFLIVAECGSITTGAERMGVSQPRMSLLIRKFEQQLGFELFHRTSRSIRLTGEGREFHAAALQLQTSLTNTEAVARGLRDRQRSRLRIGAPLFSAEVPARVSLIDSLLQAFPHQRIEVRHGDGQTLLLELRAGELDVVILPTPLFGPQNLETLRLEQAQLSLGVPPGHFLDRPGPLPVGTLRQMQVGVLPRSIGDGLFDAWFGIVELAGADLVEAPEAAASSLVNFGRARGLPVLLYRWRRDIDTNMVWRPLVDPAMTIDLVVCRPAGPGRRKAIASAFWDLAQAHALD